MPWKDVNPDITGETELGGRRVKVRAVRYDPESKVTEARVLVSSDGGREPSRVVLAAGEFKPDDPGEWDKAVAWTIL